MKRLIAGTALLALASGAFASGLAEDNSELYGNIIWDKELQERADKDRVRAETADSERYGTVYRDEKLLREADREGPPRTFVPHMGDTYGSILYDIGVDPEGYLEE